MSTANAVTTAILPGQQLGNYRLLQLLGKGGSAHVYLGEHLSLGTRVAIKVFHTFSESTASEHLHAEAQIMARLNHAHIVRELEFGIEKTTAFLVMEYAEHGTLRNRYPRGSKLPLATIVKYVKQIADALQYLHHHGLIHRDIKPDNLLLTQDNQILLSDFGIATSVQDGSDASRYDVSGTARYMAPEQFHGKPCIASDQYALGAVVYEWLCGEAPFNGSYWELVHQHLQVLPSAFCEKGTVLSEAIENVVLKALAKDPAQRFNCIQEFADALEAAYLQSLEKCALLRSWQLWQPQLKQDNRYPVLRTRRHKTQDHKFVANMITFLPLTPTIQKFIRC